MQTPDVPCKVTATEWSLQRICQLSQLSNVTDIMLSTPVSNAWPERGASCVKWVKTRCRSTLKNDMLQALLHVSINGPAPGTDAVKSLTKEAVRARITAKCRRRIPKVGQASSATCSHSESELVLVDAGVQTDSFDEGSEEMSVRLTEEVEAFCKAFNLPDDGSDDDDDNDDEGFEDKDFYD